MDVFSRTKLVTGAILWPRIIQALAGAQRRSRMPGDPTANRVQNSTWPFSTSPGQPIYLTPRCLQGPTMSASPVDQAHDVPVKSGLLNVSDSEKGLGDREADTDTKYTLLRFLHRISALLAHYGVETHGYVRSSLFQLELTTSETYSVTPVPVAERVDTRWYQLFFVWFSANMNVLAYVC